MKLKQNVLIAKVEAGKEFFKNFVANYIQFFKGKQEAFRGIKKTYTAREGFHDDPSMRGHVKVSTTVKEKLDYMEENNAEHINNLFAMEATNASGKVKALLEVDGVTFGTLSSLELLRLKDFLEKELIDLYKDIPVRSDNEIWEKSTSTDYSGRDIWEQPMMSSSSKTTTISSRILEDPNIEKLGAGGKYTPQVVEVKKLEEIGDYTVQKFSGEISHVERADIQRRKSKLLIAVIAALKVANDTEIVESELTSEKLFDYLHRGK